MELKPCPFCGSPAQMRVNKITGSYIDVKVPTYYVICSNMSCEIRTLEYLKPEHAAKRWNRRIKNDL